MKLIAPRFQIILSVLIFPFAIVITSCSSPAVVSEKAPVRTGFDEGLRAYKKSDYGTALAKFRPLAEQGDATVPSKSQADEAQDLEAHAGAVA
jgi:outer membrane protein assembly factor BamD (BamD/ComL family)